MNVYVMLWVIIQSFCIYCLAQMGLALAPGSSFSWLLSCGLTPSIVIFVLFLALPHFLVMHQAHCPRSLSSPRIGFFPTEPWLLC